MQGCNSERLEDANSRESGEAEISPTFSKILVDWQHRKKIHEAQREVYASIRHRVRLVFAPSEHFQVGFGQIFTVTIHNESVTPVTSRYV